jgi:hypothetical protein
MHSRERSHKRIKFVLVVIEQLHRFDHSSDNYDKRHHDVVRQRLPQTRHLRGQPVRPNLRHHEIQFDVQGPAPRRLACREIARIALTGADAAAGRSWEIWVRKYEGKKKALAEGRDIGNIEPQPMPLDD